MLNTINVINSIDVSIIVMIIHAPQNLAAKSKLSERENNVENKCAFEISETDVNRTIGGTVYEIDMLDVSELYNLSTDNTFEYVDYLELPFHVHEYEETIRESPCKCCSCCFKILFKGQTFFIGRGQ